MGLHWYGVWALDCCITLELLPVTLHFCSEADAMPPTSGDFHDSL